LEFFDDDKRNETAYAFSIQNIVETGLMEHGRLPGEWYGVSKMNEIFQSLNETYNFDTNLSENMLGNFKICNFKNGEINS
jgi:flagellin-specific chaperone FliS